MTACKICAAGLKCGYDFKCRECILRLLKSVGENKLRQQAMLAVIAKTPGAPSHDEIVDALKTGEEK